MLTLLQYLPCLPRLPVLVVRYGSAKAQEMFCRAGIPYIYIFFNIDDTVLEVSADTRTPWCWHSRSVETRKRFCVYCVHISACVKLVWSVDFPVVFYCTPILAQVSGPETEIFLFDSKYFMTSKNKLFWSVIIRFCVKTCGMEITVLSLRRWLSVEINPL